MPTTQVRVAAPAKINLHLGVGPVQDDGFHPLATVFHAVGLWDELSLRPAEVTSVTVSGEGVDVSQVPTGSANLAVRAVHLMGQVHDRDDLGCAIHLRKAIPVAGGLAGGSTDGAAALVGVDALYDLRTPREALLEAAAELGSDVAFCIQGGTALGTGRGEQLAPLMTRGDYWWVLAPDTEGISTPAVYSTFDMLHASEPPPSPEVPADMMAALRRGDAESLGHLLHNDLRAAALSLRPELTEVLALGEDVGAYGTVLSGSGPTVAFLCVDEDHATFVAAEVQALSGGDPCLVAKGPVHGARITGARTGGLFQ